MSDINKLSRQEIMHSFYRAVDTRPDEFLDIIMGILARLDALEKPNKHSGDAPLRCTCNDARLTLQVYCPVHKGESAKHSEAGPYVWLDDPRTKIMLAGWAAIQESLHNEAVQGHIRGWNIQPIPDAVKAQQFWEGLQSKTRLNDE